MPRKTRQQKMAAALRRLKKRTQVQEPVVATPQKIQKPQPEAATTQGYSLGKLKEEKALEKPKVKVEAQRYDYTHVSSDLKKIILLSTLAIALEILLNLTMRAEFAKLLLRRFGIDI
jgi:hypothetical protein